MIIKTFTAILFAIIFITHDTHGQYSNSNTLDPYGFVTKYNTDFEGVGPKVYILPLPRTLKEEMIDSFKEISTFQDSIQTGIQYERLLSGYKKTKNYKIVDILLRDSISNDDFDKLSKQFIDNNDHEKVYALNNELALQRFKNKNFTEAIELLKIAIHHAKAANNTQDLAIIHSNIASILLLTQKYDEALEMESLYFDYTLNTKDQAEQASSYTKIALIESLKKNYKIAENTIIRKAIPLFNRSKYYDGKVDAWITLAEIYRMQNKHTEAQWFLLQAKDLAMEKNYNQKLPTIEYMLGSSKFIQGNYKFAKAELKSAWEASSQHEKHSFLHMAIAEQLGSTYVHLNDYESANTYLKYYWELRNRLFSKKITRII